MEKFGNGSKASKSRIFSDSQLKVEGETEDSCTENEKDYHEETKSFMSSYPSDKEEDTGNEASFISAISPSPTTGPNEALCSCEAAGSMEETSSVKGSCSFDTADSGIVLLEGNVWDNEVIFTFSF